MIEEKNRNFERELEDLRRRHAEQLSLMKQNHVAQEQTAVNSYNLEYRNIVWDLTLKHLGKGLFTEDLGRMLQRNLSEEQFKCEKELLELQQSCDDEIVQMRASASPGNRKRRKKRPKRDPGMMTLNPTELARKVSEKMRDFQADDMGEGPEGEALDFLLQILRQERENLASYSRPGPIRRPGLSYHPTVSAQRKPRTTPFVIDRGEPMTPRTGLKKHVAARTKLKKSVAKVDRFIHDLQGKEWFGDLFPHVQ
jgi:hypothetical protein